MPGEVRLSDQKRGYEMNKRVYQFYEGNAQMRELLGRKGAVLSELTNQKLPVPQGFIVSTEAFRQYNADGKKISGEMKNEIRQSVRKLEEMTGKKFGDKKDPLIVSVRSSPETNMPGMFGTIINVGFNEKTAEALSERSGASAF